MGTSAPTTITVAVFPIEDGTGKLDAQALDSLGEYLSGRVGAISGFSIVPRAQIREGLEQSKAETYQACFDQACQIEVGKALAAAKVVATRLTTVGKSCIVSAYIFDLRKETTDSTGTVRTSCDEDGFLSALDQLASQFGREQEASLSRGEVTFGAIKVRSRPSGGAIQVDGRPTTQVTPTELRNVPAGQHRVVIETDDSEGSAVVEVSPGATAQLELVLRERLGKLVINTAPPGAAVTVDGRLAGLSPVTVELPKGTVEIEASKDDLIGRSTVEVRPLKQALQLSIPLNPDPDAGKVRRSRAWVWWLVGGVAATAGAIALDTVPATAHNARFDALDLLPLAAYAAGGTCLLMGLVNALDY